MTTGPATILLKQVRRLAGDSANPLSDQELLGRFVAQRDEAAFEALVRRHGPMVLGVCRRVLGNAHDADDAFQAVFLVLARKASSVRNQESLGSWLYAIARRVALKAKTCAARRRCRESSIPQPPAVDPLADITLREAQTALDEELARLPEKYRAPLVLCCLEGLARDEAAGRLGWSASILKSRLEEARNLLRARLGRRGLTLPAALTAALFVPAASAIGAPLIAATVQAATGLAAGHAVTTAPQALALAQGLMQSTAATRLKIFAILTLALGVVVGRALAVREPATAGPGDKAGVAKPALAGKPPAPAERLRDPLPPGALTRLGSARLRHGAGIGNAALSDDGKWLATAAGRSVIVWDLATGGRLHHFPCEEGSTFVCPGLIFAPDGRHLGYVRGSTFACVWNLQTGKEILRFKENRRAYSCCCFTPDGKQFALTDGDKVRFWDLAARKEMHIVPAEHISLLSPDGRWYVCADESKEILLGETQTGKVVLRLEVAAAWNGIENGVAFRPDGKLLALVDRVNKSIQIRELPGGKLQTSFPLPGSAWPQEGKSRYGEYRLNFSTDGKVLLLGTVAGLAHRWDLATGKELPALKTAGNVTAVHSLADGPLLTTGDDGLVRLWDAKGQELREPERYLGRVPATLSRDGRIAALGDARGRLDLWDTASGKVLRTLTREGPAVTGLAFTPDGRSLAAALASGTVELWEVPSGELARVYRWEEKPDLSTPQLLFSPDGRRLLIHDGDYAIRMYDIPEGKLRWRGRGASVAFSPDGATVALGPGGPHLAFVDAATGKERSRVALDVRSGEGYLNVVESIAFTPDGRLLALGLYDGHVTLHDARTGAQRKRFRAVDAIKGRPWRMPLEATEYRVNTLAFSADGEWLLTGSGDNAVRVWETVTAKEVLRRNGHEGGVSCVAFGPGGRTVFSCGRDAQAYLWDLRPVPAAGARPTAAALWADLISTDAAQAYRAIWALAEDSESASRMLREKVSPVAPSDRGRLLQWIADLDNKNFRVRDAAFKALCEAGETATPVVEEALAAQPSLEVSRRLQQVLDALRRSPTPDAVRLIRAVQALELAGTPEARAVLRAWAEGAPGARLTEDARAALRRLAQRGK
ncbi:MAG TPA: sigma-70 family RNA polymerase sigma factor [Gemmataceae bacterium]|nr:sigma-70 family RNA polymerase sigma factor [Gemmataceae bacterium]